MDKKYILPLLFAAACFLLSSCIQQKGEVKAMLAAADSLIGTDPSAALYSIMSIDSTVIPELNKSDRAKYLLLKTQARYKCRLPVSEDTAIDEAVCFYRRKGPETRYAAALTMQGAVYAERGLPISALERYKEAEYIRNSLAFDPIESGLLHTHIAELYQQTYVNDSLAVSRYRKALDCFMKTDRKDMILSARLALGKALLPLSTREAIVNILEGEKIANELNDSAMIFAAKDLEINFHFRKNNFHNTISIARDTYNRFRNPILWTSDAGTNILYYTSKAYARCGKPDSARIIAAFIPQNAISDASRHFLDYDIALSEKDYKTALSHHLHGERLADSILASGYAMHLRGAEKHFETTYMSRQLSIFRSKCVSTSMIMLGIMFGIAAIGFIIYIRNTRLKREVEKYTDIIRSISNGNQSTVSNTSNMRNREYVHISEEMLKVADELMEAYYKYGKTKVITDQVKSILKIHFPEEGTMSRVRRIVDATYPGFLSGLESSYPALKEKDIYLIALMACGFSTGTICALRRISESSLYVEKTRIAKKIGDGIRLSDFIAKTLNDYRQS